MNAVSKDMKPVPFVSRNKGQNSPPKPHVSGIRIALIDDHELFRSGIRLLFSANEAFSIEGEAKDRIQVIDLVKRDRPGIILLNIGLKSGDGDEA